MTLLLLAAAVLLACLVLSPWVVRQPVRGLYLTIFATSVLITPNLPVVREKIAAPEVAMACTWAAMVLNLRGWRQQTVPVLPGQRTALVLGGAFCAAVFVSFFLNNIEFEGGLAGSMVEAANYAYGFLMFATVVWLVDDWEKWSRCVIAWILGAALVSLVGLWALTGSAPQWTYDDFTGRISSTLRLENQVPSFLLPVLPAVVFLGVMRGVSAPRRILYALLIVGMTATVFGTGSRTALGMLAICLAGVFWVACREARHRVFDGRLLASMALLLVAGLVGFIVYVIAHYNDDYRLGATPPWQRGIVMLADWLEGERALDETRPEQLRAAFETFSEFPILGAGPKLFGARLHVSEVHNTYVGVLIETGLIGFAALALWLAYVVGTGWRSARGCVLPENRLVALALFVGFVALLAYGFFIFGLRQRNIWLLAGLLMALPRLNTLSWLHARSSAGQRSADQHARIRQPGDRSDRFARPRPVRRELSAGRLRPAANHALPPGRVRPGHDRAHRGGAGRGAIRR